MTVINARALWSVGMAVAPWRSPETASGDGYEERVLGLPVLTLYPEDQGCNDGD